MPEPHTAKPRGVSATFGQSFPLSVRVESNGRDASGHYAATVTFTPGPGFDWAERVGYGGWRTADGPQRTVELSVIGGAEAQSLVDALDWAARAARLQFEAADPR